MEDIYNGINIINCPQIVVKQKGRTWFIYDNISPIVGKGISREAALKCYHRGLDLLQQKYAGVDTGINAYLDYLEQQKNRKEKIMFDNYKESSVCNDCEIGDVWECQLCCAKCYEDYGECPDPECNPMDI